MIVFLAIEMEQTLLHSMQSLFLCILEVQTKSHQAKENIVYYYLTLRTEERKIIYPV